MGQLPPIGSDSGPVGPGGDDFAATVLALGMIHQPHDAEREILHCAQTHWRLPHKGKRIMT
jgi:hypothetical protein